MTGHLGRRVSALLDGQLDPDEANAAWRHVHACPTCCEAVEREGWVKTRLAGLSPHSGASDHLKGCLRDLTPLPAFGPPSGPAGFGGQDVTRGSLGRRLGLAAVGGGAVGVAVVGVLALGPGVADAPMIERRTPPSQVTPILQPAPVTVRLRH